MFLLGYDLGSSSVKTTLLDAHTGRPVASATSPETELAMIAHQPGWAEQDPEMWWEHIVKATRQVLEKSQVGPQDIRAIGIAYQMHGLVLIDKAQQVLRPAIIWCDSRAVGIGERAFAALGPNRCLVHLLNSPGNFTASKLRWVQENEPALFDRVDKFMLPGDYIALRLTGEATTTASGLSEGILWDFSANAPADLLLQHYGIPPHLVPRVVPTFAVQGQLTAEAARELGLAPGTPITYRAGDQPNNAYSLKVLYPGEIAATAGTSGVVYGINDQYTYDPESRVNTFVHVNHTKDKPSTGTLLCVNGTGSQNSWLRRTVFTHQGQALDYVAINQLAAQTPVGSGGIVMLPFGNGAERPLANRELGGSIHGLQFNLHTQAHLARAAQEGIAAALRYGTDIMASLGIQTRTVRAGDANMFLSPIFAQTFANFTGAVVELYNTDGSHGSARAAGVGAGIYHNFEESFVGLGHNRSIEPQTQEKDQYEEVYQRWLAQLKKEMGQS
jgi:xylulokinase